MKKIQVVAALLVQDQKILIAQRLQKKSFGGKWELVGGKIEKNETPQAALQRELAEEMGINAQIGDFFMQVQHQYPDFQICLSVYWVTDFEGQIRLTDHSQALWVSPNELKNYDFTEADLPIIAKISNYTKLM